MTLAEWQLQLPHKALSTCRHLLGRVPLDFSGGCSLEPQRLQSSPQPPESQWPPAGGRGRREVPRAEEPDADTESMSSGAFQRPLLREQHHFHLSLSSRGRGGLPSSLPIPPTAGGLCSRAPPKPGSFHPAHCHLEPRGLTCQDPSMRPLDGFPHSPPLAPLHPHLGRGCSWGQGRESSSPPPLRDLFPPAQSALFLGHHLPHTHLWKVGSNITSSKTHPLPTRPNQPLFLLLGPGASLSWAPVTGAV